MCFWLRCDLLPGGMAVAGIAGDDGMSQQAGLIHSRKGVFILSPPLTSFFKEVLPVLGLTRLCFCLGQTTIYSASWFVVFLLVSR